MSAYARGFALALLSAVVVLAADFDVVEATEMRRDGTWWNAQTQGEKVEYVIGFFDGLSFEDDEWKRKLRDKLPLPTSSNMPSWRLILDYDGAVEDAVQEQTQHDFSHVPAGQLREGLDKVFADYRNRRILVTNAIYVVLQTINGASDAKVEEILEFDRKKSSE